MKGLSENALQVAALGDVDLFHWLCGFQEGDVPGILRIKRGSPSIAGIVLVGSHGKEIPAGLSVLRTLLIREKDLAADIDLIIAVGNIDAARNFFQAESAEERAQCRFTPNGKDMNRLPMDYHVMAGNAAIAEYVRATELDSVLGTAGEKRYVLDIHSTDNPSAPSALGIVGSETETIEMVVHLPVPQVIMNVVAIQGAQGTKTRTLSSVFNPNISLEVETGQTGSPEAKVNAAIIFEAWAVYFGFLPGKKQRQQAQRVYRVIDSVMAPDTCYQVVDNVSLDEFTPVSKGKVLLQNPGGDEIFAPCDGLLIWGPCNFVLTESDVVSEIWFIVEKV